MPLAKALKNYKIVTEVKILWRLVAVGNGWLWLTPCKRMKLRRSEWAQLGDSTKECVSLVEGRLWSKLLMQPRPIVSDAHHFIFGLVSKLRSQASLHGVNHNMPFPTALKPLFSTFSVLSPLACFDANSNISVHFQQTKRTVPLVCGLTLVCKTTPFQEIILSSGFLCLFLIPFTIRNLSPEFFL